MKKIFLLVALIATMFTQLLFAQETKSSTPASLLPFYYSIKDALVNGDAAATALKAGNFLKAANDLDIKSLSEADRNAFNSIHEKLAFDARHISESKDIAHQREHFANFSANFFKLAKAVNLAGQTVYYDYCPMKKIYWLSADAAIRNPYFGNQMLTCGKIAETLKK
ncbi:DUF3347 domain-containing protein [Mucilaginibacter sp. UR6-1]|uniref:DUF3347 domain-containing protein n=1 Tax=Mucilaginibacter sp. UR6-1 TaxID=1435643 RepID=UPI001E627F78|nr:DUF3347 domain-containing protein [Mucilaginibacter sp. UR6-1]MCC8407772.1 DUF3347 domain-containing protein [Mucilaginibacter sp. UR6-1]